MKNNILTELEEDWHRLLCQFRTSAMYLIELLWLIKWLNKHIFLFISIAYASPYNTTRSLSHDPYGGGDYAPHPYDAGVSTFNYIWGSPSWYEVYL